MNKNWLQTLLTATILFSITTVLYLYTSGYRLGKEKELVDLRKTGMIGAKSIPEGANVYINDELYSATNDTIPGLEPGKYNMKMVKNGFVTWTKEVEIFPELVTDITAVLVSQSPRLEPLTNTGAQHPAIAPSLSRIAFFSKDKTSPGIWVMPLIEGGLSLFRANALNVLEDTFYTRYSDGVNIEWSPDEKTLLIELLAGTQSTFYMIDLINNTAQSTSAPELLRQTWTEELTEKRANVLESIELPEEIKTIATDNTSMWSPDNKKFLYKLTNGNTIEYRVYNMEKPIPVGEKKDSLVFTTDVSGPQPKLNWYSDSFHLIMTEGFDATENRGIISLIRIDGTNKTEIYNSTLLSDKVFSAPGGDKLIMLTSFKSGEQADLYTLGIR